MNKEFGNITPPSTITRATLIANRAKKTNITYAPYTKNNTKKTVFKTIT